jgi:hypothetical protein
MRAFVEARSLASGFTTESTDFQRNTMITQYDASHDHAQETHNARERVPSLPRPIITVFPYYAAVTPASAVHVAPLTTCAASEHKNKTISAILFTSQNSPPPKSGSGSRTISIGNDSNETREICRRTVLSHAADTLHIYAFGREIVANIGGHRTSSNDIAANAFGAVEGAGVFRQADQTVLACCVCGAC